MRMDHTQAPVLEALAAYQEGKQLGFSPPGHKHARGAAPEVRAVLGDAVFFGDVLASGGLDDRRTRSGVLQRAEELMADAVHAEHTFFSTCGSSLSVKAAMLSVAWHGEKLLIGRDAHKSVVAGLVLSGIEPVWIDPQWDAERHLAHAPSAEAFEQAFLEHPDARGALVTSPTPYGSAADLAAIAEVCHRRGRPLVVDEAWGAHLPFHPDLPSWAMDAGADVCVTSIHKMGSGLEQGSVFHLRGDLVDHDTLASRADLLGTTSPSVLLYAAIDGWRRQMALNGRALLAGALDLAARVRQEIEGVDGMHVNDRADFCGPGAGTEFDPLPVVIDVSGLGTSGYRAADWLREHHHIDMHLVDHRRISAQLTHADDAETAGRLLTGLRDLARTAHTLGPAPDMVLPSPTELRQPQVCLPRDAYFSATEDIPVEEAVGRVAAEMMTPYPPGIPAVVPGERLTEPVLRYLRTGIEAGMNVPDPADPLLRTVRVCADGEGP
ncbi:MULTISPECIES: aminotransferase class I/II-fold pyridoxal phosphate-dependent enzyme [Streptomyces]|uniref:aminotransferase class I/II-fold pyridoxal phosphate-dependent enzyme n=1 Tax=Streptomyces TaxID=1883 RepID=UPI00081B2037|nr:MULTISPECIES: ornithine decarboxylase [unclassified Streptomyces]MYQ54121.1 ornithine decarboxylase [Streptomyces sp. SID4941]SCE18431.1 lysine decarboxylase [Streptomyces sp. PalvLS-984]SDC95216.1 lysine decarboxylase [Streptomyces sp. AmelKG-A3]